MGEKLLSRMDSKESSDMRTHLQALYARLTPEYKKEPGVRYKGDLDAKNWNFEFEIGENGIRSFTEGICTKMFGVEDFSGLTKAQREYVDHMVYITARVTGLDMNYLKRGEKFSFTSSEAERDHLTLSLYKNGNEVMQNAKLNDAVSHREQVKKGFGGDRMDLSKEIEGSNKKRLVDAATKHGTLVSVMQAFVESVSLDNRRKMLQGLDSASGFDESTPWSVRADQDTINGINQYLFLHFKYEKGLEDAALNKAMEKHRIKHDGTAYNGTAEQNGAWVRFIRNQMLGDPSGFTEDQMEAAQKAEFMGEEVYGRPITVRGERGEPGDEDLSDIIGGPTEGVASDEVTESAPEPEAPPAPIEQLKSIPEVTQEYSDKLAEKTKQLNEFEVDVKAALKNPNATLADIDALKKRSIDLREEHAQLQANFIGAIKKAGGNGDVGMFIRPYFWANFGRLERIDKRLEEYRDIRNKAEIQEEREKLMTVMESFIDDELARVEDVLRASLGENANLIKNVEIISPKRGNFETDLELKGGQWQFNVVVKINYDCFSSYSNRGLVHGVRVTLSDGKFAINLTAEDIVAEAWGKNGVSDNIAELKNEMNRLQVDEFEYGGKLNGRDEVLRNNWLKELQVLTTLFKTPGYTDVKLKVTSVDKKGNDKEIIVLRDGVPGEVSVYVRPASRSDKQYKITIDRDKSNENLTVIAAVKEAADLLNERANEVDIGSSEYADQEKALDDEWNRLEANVFPMILGDDVYLEVSAVEGTGDKVLMFKKGNKTVRVKVELPAPSEIAKTITEKGGWKYEKEYGVKITNETTGVDYPSVNSAVAGVKRELMQ